MYVKRMKGKEERESLRGLTQKTDGRRDVDEAKKADRCWGGRDFAKVIAS